jgi:hypothetical protein
MPVTPTNTELREALRAAARFRPGTEVRAWR